MKLKMENRRLELLVLRLRKEVYSLEKNKVHLEKKINIRIPNTKLSNSNPNNQRSLSTLKMRLRRPKSRALIRAKSSDMLDEPDKSEVAKLEAIQSLKELKYLRRQKREADLESRIVKHHKLSPRNACTELVQEMNEIALTNIAEETSSDRKDRFSYIQSISGLQHIATTMPDILNRGYDVKARRLRNSDPRKKKSCANRRERSNTISPSSSSTPWVFPRMYK
eukprot:TRINITY_DN11634_c0_g2_i1.p1 TRINITY_DN11634_c0_g2~~TRINITY_DN11634_c0_g2_i1.p1  ORF type:complete len:223 (+),score=20.30 TRINITY_DN11634_c0_g2_i1:3-671(+)